MTETSTDVVKIALADDHVLLRNSLARLINTFQNVRVILEVASGTELIAEIKANDLPDVILLDLNMPGMNGFDTAIWLHDHHPSVKILMLTMYDSDQALIRLLQAGVKGFLKKDIHPAELHFAISSVVQSGFYYSQHVSGKMAGLFRNAAKNTMALEKAMLTAQELAFLKLAATDYTYKEVAAHMKLNPRGVDTLRDGLFAKLDVKSRVGLAMYAMRHGIVGF